MLNKKKNNKGFTLVELLVVIAIIGILAVVAVPALFKNIEKGKVADLEADISAIRSAALSYYAEKSEYPVDTNSANTTEGKNDLLKANDKLDKELEELSNPFNATSYELQGVAPAPLKLIITQASGSELSEDAFLKLRSDLGSDVVPFNNVVPPAVSEPSDDDGSDNQDGTALSTPPAAGTKYDPEQPIEIILIKN